MKNSLRSPILTKATLVAAALAVSSAFACEHTIDGSDCSACFGHANEGYPDMFTNPNYTGGGSPVVSPFTGGASGDLVMPGTTPPGGGTMSTSVPPVNAGGVFAPAYLVGGDSRQRTAKTLLIYCHDFDKPDLSTATCSPGSALGASTRADYLKRIVNVQRQWMAVNSGGKMDSTFTLIDSGGINYRTGTTPWAAPGDLINSILAAQNLVRSDYDYIQLVWDDMMNSPYASHLAGSSGQGNVGDGMGTETNWSTEFSRNHELGHNLGLNHARNVDNTTAGASRYNFNFATGQYVAVSSTSNSIGVQMQPLTVGLVQNDYGNPIDVMASSTGRQYSPRDKARAGWFDKNQFAQLTPGANGVASNITLHDPTELVAVVNDNSVNPTTGLVNGAYGVVSGYANTPYAATFVRKGQTFVANAGNTGGKWVTGVQVIDLSYEQITPTTYGIEFRVDGSYYGMIQLNQSISEKNFGQYNFIVTKSPFGTQTTPPDLVNDLHATAPDNPNRYRSTWYDIAFTGNFMDAIGHYAGLLITTHIGSTVSGFRWDASAVSGVTQDGGGVWNGASTNWKNVDTDGANTVWADNNDATFGAASGVAGSVTVNGVVIAKSLTFKPANAGAYTLTGGTISLGAGGINAEASANLASALNFTDQQVWEVLGGNTVTVSGGITANGNALQKLGLGDILLTAANTLPTLDVYEGTVTQTASQTVTKNHLHDSGQYIVQSGSYLMNNNGSVAAEKGFTGTMFLNSTGSTAAAPDIAFLADLVNRPNVSTSGEFSARLMLGAGNHYLTASRGYFTNYDFSLNNSLYKSAKISGDIGGVGGITYRGTDVSAQLVLTGNNTFTGDLTLEHGSLHLVGANALNGQNRLTFTTLAGNDARLYLRGQNRVVKDLASSGAGLARIANFPAADNGGTATASLTVISDNATTFAGVMLDTLQESTGNGNAGYGSGSAGALSLVKQGASTLTLTGNNTYTGTTTIGAGTLRIGEGGTSGTLGIGAVVNNATLAFDRSDAVTVANAVSGSGTIEKNNTNVITYTGVGTNTGVVAVNTGGLIVNGSFGNTTVNVASAATLGGTGNIGNSGAPGATINFASNSTLLANSADVVPGHLHAFGNVNLNGTTFIDFATATVNGTTYRVLDYSGSLTNSANFRALVRGTIDTATAGQVNLTASATLNLVWQGATDGGWGVVDGKNNFFSGGVQDFYNLDTVLMDDTAVTRAVTLNGNLRPASVTVNNSVGNDYTWSGTGSLFGVGTLTKQGDGTLIITNNNANTGATAITGGSIRVGNNTASGSLGTGGVDIGAGASLVMQRSDAYTLVNAITGAGTLRQSGAGILSLNTDNSGFTGFTVIDAGTTLDLGLATAAGTSAITAAGTLQVSTASNLRLANALSGTGTILHSGAGRLDITGTNTAFNGKIVLTAGTLGFSGTNPLGVAGAPVADHITVDGATIDNVSAGLFSNRTIGTNLGVLLNAGGLTVTGSYSSSSGGFGGLAINSVVSGVGAIRKTGACFLSLGNANTFQGGVIVTGGTGLGETRSTIELGNAGGLGAGALTFQNTASINGLRFNTAAATGTVSNNIILSSAAGVTNRWTIGAGKTATFAGGISGGEATSSLEKFADGTMILTGANTYLGVTTISAGILQVGAGGATGSLGLGAVVDNAALTFNRTGSLLVANAISGAGTLNQAGAGTTILTGANTYAGTTTVSAGILQVGDGGASGSLGSGAVANAASLVFNRSDANTVANAVSGAGTLTQAGTGVLTLSGASTYTGATSVNAGTLNLAGSLGNTFMSVASGAMLTGSGSTLGAVSVADGARISQTQGGTLTTGALTLGAASIIDVSLANPGTTALFSAHGNLTLDGVINITAVGPFGPGVYRTFDYTGTLTDNTVTIGALPPGRSASDFTVQTTLPGQVNLVNLAGVARNFWDGDGVVTHGDGLIRGGDGAWNTTNDNWTDGAGTVNGTQSTGFAIFQNTGGTVTVSNSGGAVSVTGFQFAVNGYTLAGQPLTLANDPTSGDATLRVGDATATGAGYTAVITAVLQGAAKVNKTDLGTLVLAADNTYTGSTTISGGTLQLGDGGGAGSINGLAVVNNGTLAFDRSGTFTFANAISGNGALKHSGTGTTTLGGVNTFTGLTTVTAGKLALAAGSSVASATVNAGGALGGAGTVRGDLLNGGLIEPGFSTGTLSVTGNYTQTALATLRVEIAAASDFDRVVVTGAASLAGTLDVSSYLGFTPTAGQTYTILSAGGGITGAFASILESYATLRIVTVYNTNDVTLNFLSDSVTDQSYTVWDGGVGHDDGLVQGGSGVWSASNNNWTTSDGANNGAFGTLPVFAEFRGTAGTVTVDDSAGPVAITGAVFSVNGYTLAGDAITLVNDVGTATLNVGDGTGAGAAMTATVASVLQGAANLTKSGAGKLVLTGANTYTGTTTISDGTLQIGDGGTTGTLGAGAVVNDASLVFDRSDVLSVANAIGGSGTLTQAGSGTLVLTGANSYAGVTTISAGTLQIGSGGATGTLGSAAVVNDGALVINRSGAITVANLISGTGAFTQAGSGTTTLTAANDYAGVTTVSAGTLALDLSANENVIRAGNTLDLKGGTLDFVSGANAQDFGAVRVVSGANRISNSGYTGTVATTGGVNLGAFTLAGGVVGIEGLGVDSSSGKDADSWIRASGLANSLPYIGAGVTTNAGTDLVATNSLGNLVVADSVPYSRGATAFSNSASALIKFDAVGGTGAGDNGRSDDGVITLDPDTQTAGAGAGHAYWAGIINAYGTGVTTLDLGADTLHLAENGVIVASAGSDLTIVGGDLTAGGTVIGTAGTITVAGVNGVTIGASLVNNGAGVVSLVISGPGTTTLTGENTYTGLTTISAGTLQVGDGGTTGTLGTGAVVNHAALVFNRLDTLTVANAISGIGALTQTGTGLTTLTGNNTYAGLTTISAGTLQVGDGGTTGTLGTGAVVDDAALVFNRSDSLTVANAISGAGTLAQAGTGTVILTGNNTYAGVTTISSGTLQVGAGGTAGTLGSGAVVNDATLVFNRSDALTVANAISGAGALTKAGAGTLILTANNAYAGVTTVSAGTLQIGAGGTTGTLGIGEVVNDAALVFNRSGTLTVANAISGAGTITVTGPGTTVLTGANAMSGIVTVDTNASLRVGDGALDGTLGTSRVVNNGTLIFDRSDLLTVVGEVTGSGTLIQDGEGTTVLAGNFSYDGALVINAGKLQIGAGGAAGTLLSGTVTNNTELVLDSSGTSVLAADIGGTGDLVHAGTGTTTLTGANTYTGLTTVDAGLLNIGAGSSTGSVIINSGGTLGGRGTVRGDLFNGGTLSPGFSPGTLTVTGNYIQSATATLRVELASAADFDRVVVTGAATLAGKLQLASHGGFIPLDGQSFTILTAGGGVTGEFSEVENPFAALGLSVVYNPGDVTLLVSLNSLRAAAVASGHTPNRIAVAGGLDDAVAADPAYATLASQVAGLDNAGFAAALASLSPQGYDRMWDNARYTALQTVHTVENRLRARDAVEPGQNIWMQVQRRVSRGDGDADIAGSDLSGNGVVVGADTALGDAFTVGAMFLYSEDTIRPGSGFNIKSRHYLPGIYAGYRDDGVFVDGAAGMGYADYTNGRDVVIGGSVSTAKSRAESWEHFLGGRAGYEFRTLGDAVRFAPYAGFRHTRWSSDGFRESGAGLADLTVRDRSAESTVSRLGLMMNGPIQFGDLVITPKLDLAWRHEFQESRRDIGASFGSAPFAVRSASPARDGLDASIGLDVRIRPGMTVYADVSSFLDGSSGHSEEYRVGVNFRF